MCTLSDTVCTEQFTTPAFNASAVCRFYAFPASARLQQLGRSGIHRPFGGPAFFSSG